LNSLLDGSDLEGWKQAWDTGANLPISGTLPREVIELCAGLGGRAPTVEEWLWAAWGGREDRLYPWGKAPLDATRLNLKEHARVRSGDDDVVDEDGFNAAAPVGSYPRGAGRWGHLDLAGNLSETVFPTLGREGVNVDRSELSECGLDYTYEDEKAPASVHNFALCMRGPSNESCTEHTFRDWRLLPCVGADYAGATEPDTSSGFRCAADPAPAVKERSFMNVVVR
jgi:formylglycine-generating enzyme required for sulfatase activity